MLASQSTDARDKYFATYAGEFAPCSSKELRSELPALEAARASVGAVVAELTDILPKLPSCLGSASFITESLASGSISRKSEQGSKQEAFLESAGRLSQSVDAQNGLDKNGILALLQEARRIIISVRGALF